MENHVQMKINTQTENKDANDFNYLDTLTHVKLTDTHNNTTHIALK